MHALFESFFDENVAFIAKKCNKILTLLGCCCKLALVVFEIAVKMVDATVL